VEALAYRCLEVAVAVNRLARFRLSSRIQVLQVQVLRRLAVVEDVVPVVAKDVAKALHQVRTAHGQAWILVRSSSSLAVDVDKREEPRTMEKAALEGESELGVAEVKEEEVLQNKNLRLWTTGTVEAWDYRTSPSQAACLSAYFLLFSV
jgi:hypothetical protein